MQAEEDLLLWCESRRDRRVERVHDGRSDFEVTNNDVGKFVVKRSLRGESGGESPLTALDEIERGMIAGESLGRTGERVAFEL